MSDGNGSRGAKPPPPPVAYYDFAIQNQDHASTVTPNDEPSMTRQEFAEECDINVLMKRYENRDIGALMRAVGEPTYVDFTEMPSDLMGFMQLMGDAETAFMTLPATVRREFDNNAMAFVDYASDPGNLDQMRSWGLAPPAPEVPPASPPAAPFSDGSPPEGGTGTSST